MFSRLPESNAQRQKRGGGLILSAAVHVVLIVSAVRATALTAKPPEKEVVPPIFIVPPEAPPAPRSSPPSGQPRISGAPALPSALPEPVALPTEIPITIPEPGSMSSLLEHGFDRPPVPDISGGGEGAAPIGTGGQPLEERHVDRAVMAIPGTVAPRYPSMLRSAGIEGDVRAQFVVDTLGRVETGSVRILESTHESFSQAVRDALSRARFVPAEARGRKVRQLVEQPFSFKLTDR